MFADPCLDDAEGPLLEGLAAPPIPVLGPVARSLDDLFAHCDQRLALDRLDRIFDDDEAVFLESLDVIGGG